MNPDVDARTHAKISTGKKGDKFGINIELIEELYAKAAAFPSSMSQAWQFTLARSS